MTKILFASDIDNTLIYSYKHKNPNDICIEINKGKEQGFMTKKSADMLKKVCAAVDFVPVTTRSIEQYQRINWSPECEPEYAITTNGAVLLKKNIRETWYNPLKYNDSGIIEELKKLSELFTDEKKFLRCRIVDNSYLFAYCSDLVDIKEYAEYVKKYTNMNVNFSGRKLYIFPDNINKGNAVSRFVDKFKPDFLICAGDSAIDASMLKIADLAIVPFGYNLTLIEHDRVKCCPKNEIFSEFVLKTIIQFVSINSIDVS